MAAGDWPAAIARLRSVLDVEPGHADAIARLELVRARARHLPPGLLPEASGVAHTVQFGRAAQIMAVLVVALAVLLSVLLGMWAGS